MRLFVVEPRGSGGMAHYAHQLCNALSSHISDVTLITAKDYELENYPRQYRLNRFITLWNLRSSQAPPKCCGARAAWRLFRAVRRAFRGARFVCYWVKLTFYLIRERPHVVQFGSIEFPFEAVFLRFLKARGLTLAQICHEFEPRERCGGPGSALHRVLLSKVFDSFAALFFPSAANLERFRELYPRIPAERCHAIAMGNEHMFTVGADRTAIRTRLKERYSLTNLTKVILFFGNITPSKGIPDLLRAFMRVHVSNPHARLVIAGQPLKYMDVNRLHEIASECGIQGVTTLDLHYLPLEEVGPLMELATVVVFPYISSTQSASLQLAYSFGKPVVATKVGGLPEVVEEGQSGFLVAPNSPDELAEAILRVLHDPGLAEQMGQYGKRLSETRFAWDPISHDIAGVYRHLPGAEEEAVRLLM